MKDPSANATTPTIDFTTGVTGFQFRSGGVAGHPLLKAAKTRPGERRLVVDATAGLGRDAFILALGGVEVTLIERSEEIVRQLAEALHTARAHSENLAAVVSRMTLLSGDARALLPSLAPDIVFVDPMHPMDGRKALSRKDIRALRTVVGNDDDGRELVEVALAAARHRVVLKWPTRADLIPGLPTPTFQMPGRTMTYHVYHLDRSRDES